MLSTFKKRVESTVRRCALPVIVLSYARASILSGAGLASVTANLATDCDWSPTQRTGLGCYVALTVPSTPSTLIHPPPASPAPRGSCQHSSCAAGPHASPVLWPQPPWPRHARKSGSLVLCQRSEDAGHHPTHRRGVVNPFMQRPQQHALALQLLDGVLDARQRPAKPVQRAPPPCHRSGRDRASSLALADHCKPRTASPQRSDRSPLPPARHAARWRSGAQLKRALIDNRHGPIMAPIYGTAPPAEIRS